VTFAVPWIRQVIRVLTGQPFVEIEYTIGPIPIDDGRGKEVVTRYSSTTGIPNSNATFYTDANGREFQRRQRNHRPSWDLSVYEPVAGNFYPVNAAIYVEDGQSAMAVVVDRSQAGTSLHDGALELLVQRRIVADDARGVGEALNETCEGMTAYPPYGAAERRGGGVVIRGVHRLLVGAGPVGASLARSVMDLTFAEPLVFVACAAPRSQKTAAAAEPVSGWAFSGLQAALPENVFVVTLAQIPDRNKNETTILLRLGHQYGMHENETLSTPVSIDITTLFLQNVEVTRITEMTLSGNEKWEEYLERRLVWGDDDRPSKRVVVDGKVNLLSMEIRTFEVTWKQVAGQSNANREANMDP
jgi:hypothetical protein